MLRYCLLLVTAFLVAGCNLQVGQPSPVPTPDIPQIEFQAPANNDSFVEGTDLTIALVAQDTGVGVARVELLVDDLPYREVSPEVSDVVPVFTVTMNWLAEGTGYHSLTAIAYRPDGVASRPVTISILITDPNDAATTEEA
ncbi:MAG: hypothetical protein CL610_17620 [Anaerolineaceae bacterium]|nr:hypothetical protein [Anaerolineaceae bacterium]